MTARESTSVYNFHLPTIKIGKHLRLYLAILEECAEEGALDTTSLFEGCDCPYCNQRERCVGLYDAFLGTMESYLKASDKDSYWEKTKGTFQEIYLEKREICA